MKKQKNNDLSIIKEAWRDPKYKALIKLTMWFIFFLILIMCVRFCQNEEIEKPTLDKQEIKITKIEAMKNFEYEIEIKQNQDIINVKGIKYSNINDFEILNTKEKYTIKDNLIIKKDNQTNTNPFLFELNSLFPDQLKDVLIKENVISEITYQNKETKKEYKIPTFNILTSKPIQDITVYEDENYITKIEIDLSKNMNLLHSSITNYYITITYQNINQIQNYHTS